jgi:hypothetical protein
VPPPVAPPVAPLPPIPDPTPGASVADQASPPDEG